MLSLLGAGDNTPALFITADKLHVHKSIHSSKGVLPKSVVNGISDASANNISNVCCVNNVSFTPNPFKGMCAINLLIMLLI